MKMYQCIDCPKIYDENNRPKDYVCKDLDCPGGGLTGLIIEIKGSRNEEGNISGEGGPMRESGLCILLMDASGSMGDPAFKDYSFPSKYGEKNMTKREVITDNAAKAIFELQLMVKKEDAYICAIKFDHRQAVMFTKSVADILNEFGTPHNLAKFMYTELAQMNGATDINSALRMAFNLSEKFLTGGVPGMGNYTPIIHTQFSSRLNKSIDIPNVRTLIYTDGEQLSEYGQIVNPFANMEPDILMGAYIGQEGEPGANELRRVIGKCPVHNNDQFFAMDNPQKIATLRGLFRMASGTSGFCPTCINNITHR